MACVSLVSPAYMPASAETADVWHIAILHEVIVHGDVVSRTRLIVEWVLGFPRAVFSL
jgi:hypothetical protein